MIDIYQNLTFSLDSPLWRSPLDDNCCRVELQQTPHWYSHLVIRATLNLIQLIWLCFGTGNDRSWSKIESDLWLKQIQYTICYYLHVIPWCLEVSLYLTELEINLDSSLSLGQVTFRWLMLDPLPIGQVRMKATHREGKSACRWWLNGIFLSHDLNKFTFLLSLRWIP